MYLGHVSENKRSSPCGVYSSEPKLGKSWAYVSRSKDLALVPGTAARWQPLICQPSLGLTSAEENYLKLLHSGQQSLNPESGLDRRERSESSALAWVALLVPPSLGGWQRPLFRLKGSRVLLAPLHRCRLLQACSVKPQQMMLMFCDVTFKYFKCRGDCFWNATSMRAGSECSNHCSAYCFWISV